MPKEEEGAQLRSCKVCLAVSFVIVLLAITSAFAVAEEFPNWATLSLWVGNGPSGQYSQWTLTDLTMTNEAYVANTGNVHIAFYNGEALRNYFSGPVSLGQSATNFFYVWVDSSYTESYVDVSWSWTTNGPTNAGYQWSAWENYVGGYPDFNNYKLTSERGVLRARANTNPCATSGAEYLGFTVSNVPEPSSLLCLIPGLGGITLLKRRKR